MELKLYNSLTSKVEVFHPLKEGEVSMYVCGPTVYNYPHIGNMRPVVVFDVLSSLLQHLGYHVTYVSNYTDVDDKIIQESVSEGKSEVEITSFYINEYENTVKSIGSKLPTMTPKVTDYIPQTINYIDGLIQKGHAYEVNGNVYFDVNSVPNYGQLSHINKQDLIVGARVEENPEKKSALDFALWKKTDVGIRWDSPWGSGRPGWHTECCVMVDSIFNHQLIDIHGGGYDLKFPHHENEIAQSMGYNGHALANYWVHNSFINIENEKMSKSLGNVILAKDLVAKYSGPVVRLVILSTHYRQTVNFTDEVLENANNEMKKLKATAKQARLYLATNNRDFSLKNTQFLDEFLNSLCDDLNTSNALMSVYDLEKKINAHLRSKDLDVDLLANEYGSLLEMLDILGLNLELKSLNQASLDMYDQYLKARADKDFALSDSLRSELIARDVL
ncbi:MAG: cysteine--tRNA ligase [Coprobacillus sp.]|nr:cysteine--tRNA ligase [Coprobacillus sp.]